MDFLDIFGSNLHNQRITARLTQEQLAELCNFHRTYIGLLESGKRNPSLKTIILLSQNLNCKVNDLLKGID